MKNITNICIYLINGQKKHIKCIRYNHIYPHIYQINHQYGLNHFTNKYTSKIQINNNI